MLLIEAPSGGSSTFLWPIPAVRPGWPSADSVSVSRPPPGTAGRPFCKGIGARCLDHCSSRTASPNISLSHSAGCTPLPPSPDAASIPSARRPGRDSSSSLSHQSAGPRPDHCPSTSLNPFHRGSSSVYCSSCPRCRTRSSGGGSSSDCGRIASGPSSGHTHPVCDRRPGSRPNHSNHCSIRWIFVAPPPPAAFPSVLLPFPAHSLQPPPSPPR
mmetsp:Transcript_19408/g.41460  ORF Transcript_19408/g.41460 Transcript_19408/m.41460 type:complete len:214 (+) Transcript_19408:1646-2287(+)